MPQLEDNPYAPGFGIVPPALSGREPEAADLAVALHRVSIGTYEQPRLLSGDRGIGKTALLTETLADAREAGHWTIDLEASAGGDLLATLARELHTILLAADRDARIGAAVRRARSALGSLTIAHLGTGVALGFGLDPDAGVADSGDLATDLGDTLIAVAGAAAEADVALVLAIDEIQLLPASQLAPLFGALQRTAKHATDHRLGTRPPLLTIIAGLRDARATMKDRAGTYAERLREWPLGLLDDAAATEALRVPARDREVDWHAEAVAAAVAAAGGYPYAIQTVGYETWAAAAQRDPGSSQLTRADTDLGIERAAHQLALIYRARLVDVPPAERRYLDAVARLDERERRSATIASQLGGRSQDWGWARARLIERGLLRPTGHGRVTIALPGLETHLRANPDPP